MKKQIYFNMILYGFAFLTCHNTFSQKAIYFLEIHVEFLSGTKIGNDNVIHSENPLVWGYNINVGIKSISIIFDFDARSINMKKFNAPALKKFNMEEFYFGLRYYPQVPTIRFGSNAALRFTAGILGGTHESRLIYLDSFGFKEIDDYESVLVSKIFAGFCFSSFRNTTGLSVKMAYKRQSDYNHGEFLVSENPYTLQIAFLIGSKIR